MPLIVSGFMVISGNQPQFTGVKGSFWVDKKTLDLMRLEERTTDPITGPVSEMWFGVNYARTKIGAVNVLLPNAAEVNARDSMGNAWKNTVAFESCKEYRVDSKVTFGKSR